jgi:glycosyltransferase involved in cell wall biosynthesis
MQLTNGLGIGGAEIVIRDLARTIDRDRFHLSICCLKTLGPIGRELRAEGVDIYTLPGADPDVPDYFTAVKLRRLIRDRQVDIVHSHTTHALVDAGLCRLVTRRLRTLHTFHFGNYPHKPAGDLWMERVGCRLMDQLIAVGQVQRDQVVRAHRLAPEAVGVVRNGVQLPAPGGGDPAFRATIGAEGKFLVGTIATLIPQKGLPDLLRVARQVRDQRDDVHFVVVGEGKLRPELERLRSELRLDDAVTFTGWMTNAASLALPAFDCYLQPSLWEAMSISILEAMAAAKPVVTTRVGEAPHLIAHGIDGFLFDARDVAGMASAVLTLAGDPGTGRSVGVAAARTVSAHYTVAHMARAYEQVYADLLPRTR